jgi:hypothetical protein
LSCHCTLGQNNQGEVDCTRECPSPVDAKDYVLEEIDEKDACCPSYIRKACKDAQKEYPVFNNLTGKPLPLYQTSVQVGSEWKSESDPCKDYKCLEQNGVIEKKLLNPCVTICGKVSLRLH